MQDLTFYLMNMPLSRGHAQMLTLDYITDRQLVRHRCAFASLVLQKVDVQDRLTEVGHSLDGGVFQVLRGFVLSIYCRIDTTLVIIGELLSCSMDAGFVLALPLHHGDLELDCVGVAISLAQPWLWGASLTKVILVLYESTVNSANQYSLDCLSVWLTLSMILHGAPIGLAGRFIGLLILCQHN